jgi:hypothetical protein
MTNDDIWPLPSPFLRLCDDTTNLKRTVPAGRMRDAESVRHEILSDLAMSSNSMAREQF